MIDVVKGTICHVREQVVVVMVQGVGFKIQVPNSMTFEIGHEATIITYLHWNQENGPSLFGFATELERTIFTMVIDCAGIGPKIGLAVLADLGPERFVAAVQTGNEKELSSVNGIGSKKAEQMILQLRSKVAKLLKSGIALGASGAPLAQLQEIVAVLESLNYSKPEVSDTMRHLRDNYVGSEYSFDQLVRHALSFLAKRT